jgi:hypothetical protein
MQDFTIDGEKVSIYYDGWLERQIITVVKPAILQKDKDFVVVIDGGERLGKSTLAQQLAKICNNHFDLVHICMTPEEFERAIKKASRGDAIVFDEAFTGLSSRSALSEINKILVKMMMEMGQKNLFVFIVLPSFFMLDKYVAIHRSRCLFHVYAKRGKRGRWAYFNSEKKKLLYIYGKRDMNYHPWIKDPRSGRRIILKANRLGRFTSAYTVNEQKYREKKRYALESTKSIKKSDRFQEQRDYLIYYLIQQYSLKKTNVSKIMKKSGYKLSRQAILKVVKKWKKRSI